MKFELKSIGLWSFIKVAFVVNLLAGLIGGLFALPLAAVMMTIAQMFVLGGPDPYYGDGAAPGAAIFILPFLTALGAAVVGTFFQFIVVLIYNLTAGGLGGIELNLRSVGEDPEDGTEPAPRMVRPAPPPPPPKPGPPGPPGSPAGRVSQLKSSPPPPPTDKPIEPDNTKPFDPDPEKP